MPETKTTSAKQSKQNSADQMPGFGESMAEIQEILADIEADDVDIDLLAEKVKRAAVLIQNCRDRLQSAEASVNQIIGDLSEGGDTSAAEPF